MINEIYIDNFRCLTNFRIKPDSFQLWLEERGVPANRHIYRYLHSFILSVTLIFIFSFQAQVQVS